jgi:diadenosine tetraphosphate (Ap4A) HIT family hydrolase
LRPKTNNSCPFCSIAKPKLTNGLALAIFDRFPVSTGHLLILPKRHVTDYFAVTKRERFAMEQLLLMGKEIVDKKFRPNGYNIGINVGAEAGQTIMHTHIHLIPRYKGDLPDPRGGIRGVIPTKRTY